MGNSDLGLLTLLSAWLQWRADRRVCPKLCLRPLPAIHRAAGDLKFNKNKPAPNFPLHKGAWWWSQLRGVQDLGHGPRNSQRDPGKAAKAPCTTPLRTSTTRLPAKTSIQFFFKPFSLSRSSLWAPKNCFNAKRGEVRAAPGSAQAMLAILIQD